MNVALCPEHIDILSLCTGGGGLDLGVELALPGARTVCMVEREAFAVAHLVSAMEQGLLHPAPVWSDARTFDGRAWRGCVDGLIGGIPCQPHSMAGRKHGQHDARDLWSTARRIIVQSGCWFVLIENVAGMLSAGNDEIAGAERVWRDLRKLGFAVEIGLFTAAEVGAPHQRERIFILAVADTDRERLERQRADAGAGRRKDARRPTGLCDGTVLDNAIGGRRSERRDDHRSHVGHKPRTAGEHALVDAACLGRRKGRAEPVLSQRYGSSVAVASAPVGDAVCEGPHAGALCGVHREQEGGRPWDEDPDGSGRPVDDAPVARGGTVPVQPRRQVEAGADVDRPGIFPPSPGDIDAWRAILDRAPEFEPAVRRMVDGVAAGLDHDRFEWARVDRLRQLGNGVVSLAAAYALRTLAARLTASGSAGAARLVRMML